jgi:hypothetical protein
VQLGLAKAPAEAPPAFWLEHAAPAEVPTVLVAYCSSTSSTSSKASISWPSSICDRVWVDGSGAASSPGHERR